MPYKSYIELRDLRTDGFRDFRAMLDVMKEGEIPHDQKPEVVVVKETFLLRDPTGRRIGVFSRSDADHKATVGECSVMLNGEFRKEECGVDNSGRFHYDINDRLHEHLGTYSSMFRPVASKQATLIHYVSPHNLRRYIYVIFELTYHEDPPPIRIKLAGRKEDSFIGFHEIPYVAKAIKRYNKSPFDVDDSIFKITKPAGMFGRKNSSIFNMELKPSALSGSITLFKINIIGIG